MGRAVISAVAVLAIVSVTLLGIWGLQRRLLYFPASTLLSPRAAGLAHVEPVTFESGDGLRLGGWFVPAAGPARATVLVFNGNAGNRGHRGALADALRRHGLQTLLFDYRGYGGNPGSPTERGLSLDGRAARAYLAARPDVDPSRIVYFGESLGTAVAVDVAAEHPPAALVLRSPFASMAEVGRHHYPLLPVNLLLRDRFAAIDRIGAIRVPLLVIAGERDSIVPLEHSKRLYDAAAGPKTLLVLPEAGHNDIELLSGREMIEAIVRFLAPIG
jgi:fermentation-respiration switch protein FrsA (DUF1100 family)